MRNRHFRNRAFCRRPWGALQPAAGLACLLFGANAATIPGLFNTGVDASGALLSGGAVDPHWTLIQSADSSAPGPAAYVVRSGYPIPPWLDNGPDSRWIAPQASQTSGNSPGDYVYRLRFDLKGFEPATATVTFRWSSDNAGVDVRLNGSSSGIVYDGNFGAFSGDFTLADGFVEGINTLDFVVNNAGDSVNPTGFRAELRGTAEPVAPPGTPPAITRQPVSITVPFRDPAMFTVGVYGSKPMRHQWRLDGQPILLTTNAQYFIPAAVLTNVGSYDVIVRNAHGSVTSQIASLTLTFPSPAQQTYEPPGPSSRRTGIAITEIMYHPAPRSDGRNLEFIELYNSNPFFEDISGWRFSGECDYTFPPNTILAGNSYLVVAAAPDDLRAVSGATNVLGPFDGKLANEGGTIRLRKRSGAIVLEVSYADRPPWPVAPDGTGHSLVLARPSHGERDSRAWASSAARGGSPGRQDPLPVDPLAGIVINELLGHADPGQPDFIELYNGSPRPADLAGCYLSDDRIALKFRIPDGTVLDPGGFVVFDETQLGFALDAAGEAVFLSHPALDRILDAVRLTPQWQGAAFGRFPDGAERLRTLDVPTPGTTNARPRRSAVVINEIMYHPISEMDDDQYVELHNSGPDGVDLGGWRLADGIEFRFPPGTSVAPGGFLVVARNAVRLRANHPDVDPALILGDFTGALSGRGERIGLEAPLGFDGAASPPEEPASEPVWVLINEVTYRDGGRWGRWADGGGSSLERIDPRADADLAPNWADSDETAKAPWTTVEATGPLVSPHPSTPSAEQLQLFLMGAGEALVDTVQVLVAGNNRIANSTFENGLDGWTFQGTQSHSRWEKTEGHQSARSLRLVATERGDHVVNRAFTRLQSSIPVGTSVTIRARVRWLKGHPEILLRLRGGALEAYGRLNLPHNLGTPAARNSQSRANAPPAITDVAHRPVLPASGQPIRVTARLSDPDGIAGAFVHYRIDPDLATTAVAMSDDGAGCDEFPKDGVYSAILPAQPKGTLIAFFVEALDAHAAPATSRFPADAPARECLVRVGEDHVPGAFANYRLWITAASHAHWASREKMSNDDVDATFVYGTNRVIYNAGAHYSGSSYTSPGYTSPTGNLCGYDVNFPADDRFLGERHVTLDWPVRDDTNQREQLMYWFLDQYGLPNMYRRYVHLFVNGVRRGAIYDDVQQPGRDTIEEWFPGDDRGDLYKTDCWNEFDNAGNRLDPCILNTLEKFTLPDGRANTARYRWNWRPRAVRGSANDFAPLFALVDAVNATNDYIGRVEAIVDVDHWMLTFAMNDLASFWDAFGNPNAKNTFLYKPERDSWKLMCWDFDVGLGVFNDPPDAPLFDVGDPAIRRMYQTPAFVRRYWAGLHEAMQTFFRASAIDPILDAKYAAFRANNVALNSPDAIKSWIRRRRAYLEAQLKTVEAVFAITTNNGNDHTTSQTVVSLTGTAPVWVRAITVNGIPYPLTWFSPTRWSLRLALQPGANAIEVQGLDRAGQPVADAVDSIRIECSSTNTPPPALFINEWMASNRGAVADPADGAFDDWFEIHNPGPIPISIAGFWLSDDPATPSLFVVPQGFHVPPHGYLLVWADGQPEQSRPDGDLHVNFRLDQLGERILLADATGRPIDEVVFVAQETDRSEGRWPDAAPLPFYRMSPPTPGAPNSIASTEWPKIRIYEVRSDPAAGVTLTWEALPGRTYRVRYCEDLENGCWTELPVEVQAQNAVASLTDPAVEGSERRYYQVVLRTGVSP